MFVQNLNSAQQSALVYLAHEIVKADGAADESEFAIVELLLNQSNPDVNHEQAVELDQLSALFDTERAKCSLLLELLGVAHANEEYHLSEKDLIAQYATKLGVSNEKLQALETWVEKQFALSKEVETLLG